MGFSYDDVIIAFSYDDVIIAVAVVIEEGLGELIDIGAAVVGKPDVIEGRLGELIDTTIVAVVGKLDVVVEYPSKSKTGEEDVTKAVDG